jgi:hypothetical protein
MLTSATESTEPPSSSSSTRIPPCRMLCPGLRRRPGTCGMRPDRRDPTTMLVTLLGQMRHSEQKVRTKNAATATPAPIATADAMVGEKLCVRAQQGNSDDEDATGSNRCQKNLCSSVTLLNGTSRLNSPHGDTRTNGSGAYATPPCSATFLATGLAGPKISKRVCQKSCRVVRCWKTR